MVEYTYDSWGKIGAHYYAALSDGDGKYKPYNDGVRPAEGLYDVLGKTEGI